LAIWNWQPNGAPSSRKSERPEQGVGPEAEDGGGEDMGARVPDALQLGHLRAVVRGLAFVHNRDFDRRWTQIFAAAAHRDRKGS